MIIKSQNKDLVVDTYGNDFRMFCGPDGRYGIETRAGVVGVYKIAEDFGLEDEEILQAIQRHTVGAREMSLLDKVLYVADYIEPNRDFPGVDEARRITKESLDKAVAFETAQTISYLAKKGIPIYPQTLETYNAYVGELGRQDEVSAFRH